MTTQLGEIINSFNKYINIYVGYLIPENNNYDESYLLSRIVDIALKNKPYTNELCKIIIEYLNNDNIKFKIKLFNIIDSLFKSVGKDYIDKLYKYLFKSFKECFTMSDFNERILLFKIFYTWKYIVPKNVLDKIKNDLKLDDFRKIFIKTNPGKIEKYDDYNKKMKLKMESKNNNKETINNNINNIDSLKKNNNQNVPKKIISEKKYQEDNYKNDININLDISNNIPLNKTKSKNKKSTSKVLISKKRKATQDKSIDENLSNNEIKKLSNPLNNNNVINNISLEVSNLINMNKNNNNTNEIFLNQTNLNNTPLNILLNPGINLPTLTNTLSNIKNKNNTQNNLSIRPQNQQQQQQLLQNLLLNMITNNKTLFNSNQNQIQPSIIEYKIYQFLKLTTTKLNVNLRFFSSLGKYYNESLQERDNIEIKCKYEDIYNNGEYKLIRQKMGDKLFKDIQKNVCAICGFRTLFYNNLTEHLDIHFNVNYLQMEGKNLFRKIGHNRKNWIYDDSLNYKNKNNYTLGNLLYYKNTMNNNIIKINKEQEEDNEELMFPIYDENKENCYYCGNEFKKMFSTKYNYWFYNKVIQIREDKFKYLVHQNCYDEMMKKF